MTEVHYNNIDDALAAAKNGNYTHWESFVVEDAAHERWAAEKAREYKDKPYNISNCNCWTMVYETLEAAGVTLGGSPLGSPNANYNDNVTFSFGHGAL